MNDIKQTVHDQFGKAAKAYKTSQVHAAGEDLQRIVELVKKNTGKNALDAGCGAGHTAVAIAPHVQAVVALDLTADMLAQVELLATEKDVHTVTTRQGDVENIPFDDASFDMVVSRYSAHHWPNPRKALDECRRVLRPEGKFVLSDIVAPEAPAHDTFLQTFELLRDPSHVRDHTIPQWQAMFNAAGFNSSLLFEWRLPLDFCAWTSRMATPEPQVAMLRELYKCAPNEIRDCFSIKQNCDFELYGALFQARVRT